MNILLLLKLILEAASVDIQTSEYLASLKKSSRLFNAFIQNPAVFLTRKIIGKGRSQAEMDEFNAHLSKITNLPVIHKRIMTHIKSTNFAKLQQIQKQYMTGQRFTNLNQEIVINDIDEQDYDKLIGVYVSLTSSALAGGTWTPVIQAQSGTYGIATLTYRTNTAKSYDYFNVSRETWLDMCDAKGKFGSGANSVFIHSYLGGVNKTRKSMNSDVRKNVARLNKGVTKPNKSTLGIVNSSKAKEGYAKYGKYGKS